MNITKIIKKKLKYSNKKMKIVFPEGKEIIIQNVAKYIVKNNLGHPVLIFKSRNEVPTSVHKSIEILVIDEFDTNDLANKLFEIRNGKNSLSECNDMVKNNNYFGTMMVQLGMVDSMVCGLTYTTADTLKPAFQIIKTKMDVSIATSVMIMNKGSKLLLFSDCAININPTSEQLAEITKMAVCFGRKIGIKNPQTVLLSYSTHGSGSGPNVDKVKKAKEILTNKFGSEVIEGEIQFDAAFNSKIRNHKILETTITKSTPDIFIFPEIQSSNIGYKIAQEMGGWKAHGPFILGLNKVINDLSRGASEQDVLNTSLITIYQSLIMEQQ